MKYLTTNENDIKLVVCANIVAQQRNNHEMSLRQFADELGVSHQTITKWENKKTKPTVDTLVGIMERNKEGSWQYDMAEQLMSVLLSTVRAIQ